MAEKRKRGRPKEKALDRLGKRLSAKCAPAKLTENCGRAGLTDEQTATVFGVSVRTIHGWKKDPDFVALLKKGKAECDTAVEDTLLARALGYEFNETTEELGKITKIVTKHMPPDVGAICFWLKNRKPLVWRDRHEITGADGAPVLEKVIVTVISGSQA